MQPFKRMYLWHTAVRCSRQGFFRGADSFDYISRQWMTSLDLCLPLGQGSPLTLDGAGCNVLYLISCQLRLIHSRSINILTSTALLTLNVLASYLGIQRGCRLEIIVDQDPCKSDLELCFWFFFDADNYHFYADWRISNNIFHFVTFEKSKTTFPFNGKEASRLSYLTGLLTKLPGEHIPLL